MKISLSMLYLPIVLIIVFGVKSVDGRPVPDITTTGPVLPEQPPQDGKLPVPVSVMVYGFSIVVAVVFIQIYAKFQHFFVKGFQYFWKKCRIAIIQFLEPEDISEKDKEFTEKNGWLYPSVSAAIVVEVFVGIEVLIHFFLGYFGGK